MSDTVSNSPIQGSVTILKPETQECEQFQEGLLSRRPKRKAANDALQKMKIVREWEAASESSGLFQMVADQINAEFANEKLEEDEIHEFCGDEEDSISVQSQDTTKAEAEDESAYESSFIDDEDEDDLWCSNSEDDAEWQEVKRVKFESASSESEDAETSGEEEDDTECLEAEEGVGVETHSLNIMESDVPLFPSSTDFQQDVGPQNYSHEADLADMWFL